MIKLKVAEKNGALWYGLVFYKKSRRYIDLNKAEKILKISYIYFSCSGNC